MPRYSQNVLSYRSATDLGYVIESYSVDDNGNCTPLAYWNFVDGGWTPTSDYSPAKNLKRLTRRLQTPPSAADFKLQILACPLDALAEPKAQAQVYTIGADGDRGELVETLGVVHLRYYYDANY